MFFLRKTTIINELNEYSIMYHLIEVIHLDFDYIRHRITELRLSKQISEYQLSLELGQCKSYIQGITSGKALPSVKQLYNICDYFNISLSQFFNDGKSSSLLFCNTVNLLKELDDSELRLFYNLIQTFVQLKQKCNEQDVSPKEK